VQPRPHIKAFKAKELSDRHQEQPREAKAGLDGKARNSSSEGPVRDEMPNKTSIWVLHVEDICRYEAKDDSEDSVSIQSRHEVSSEVLNPHRYVLNLFDVHDLMRELNSSPTEAPERKTHENNTMVLPQSDAVRLSEGTSSR
jgi:hypothetical protein